MTLDQALREAVAEAVAPLEREVRALRERMDATVAPQWVTIEEARQTLGCCRSTINEMIKRGDVVSKKIGRSVRIDRASLRATSQVDVDAEIWRRQAVGRGG